MIKSLYIFRRKIPITTCVYSRSRDESREGRKSPEEREWGLEFFPVKGEKAQIVHGMGF